jgi:uncharacterized protein YfiM (DUF2279 family)
MMRFGCRSLLPGILFLASACSSLAQDSLQNRDRTLISIGLGAGTAVTHIGLYQLWYKDYPSQGFAWINDNRGWLQMDKIGHGFSAFSISHVTTSIYRSTGLNKERSALYGTIWALGFQTPIELFDGLSAGWGASSGDLMANTSGALLSGMQHYFLDDAPVLLRWRYGSSPYPAMRPGTLGGNPRERWLKDYNGQSYWLSYHVRKRDDSRWPAWLGIAAGYSANGMLGSMENRWTDVAGQVQDYTHVQRYRQWFIAPDIRLSRIRTRSSVLRTLFLALDIYRLPLPAVEFSQGRMHLRPILF